MVKPTFYGIGVGPGENGLMTIKAAEILKKVSTVFTPMGKKNRPGLAYEIASEYIDVGTLIVPLPFPMIGISENKEDLEKIWEENAAQIILALKNGDVAFLTLGDPFLYSTYSYLLRYLEEKNFTSEYGIDFNIKTIPGITSFSALSAKIGVPLALGEESLAICPLTISEEEIREIFRINQNIIVMKASGKSAFLAGLIEEMNLEKNFCILSNIGLNDERISTRLDDLRDGIPYLSTILVKKNYRFNFNNEGKP